MTAAEQRAMDAQVRRLIQKEGRILANKGGVLPHGKMGAAQRAVMGKVPTKMIAAIEAAFEKGFLLVLSKGTGLIEKTYDAAKMKAIFDSYDGTLRQGLSGKKFRRLDRQASRSVLAGEGISAVEGAALGLLGIGLPDIPLLIAVLLRTVYRVAAGYGYAYESQGERVFILYIICAAVTEGEKRATYAEAADQAGVLLGKGGEPAADFDLLASEAAHCLAGSMLGAKIIQGVPLVGAVAALANNRLVGAVGKMARIKYKKRYLRGLSVSMRDGI